MYQKKYEKILQECLTEMFSRVGEKFSWKYCEEKDWYHKKTWTVKQEGEFCEWMKKYLKKKGFNSRSVKKEVGYFLLSYGWKTELN